MANELNSAIGVSGLTTVTASLILANAVVVSGIACSEVPGSVGLYTGDMPLAAAENYIVMFYINDAYVNSNLIRWNGSREVVLPAESEEGLVTGILTCVDLSGVPLAGVTHTLKTITLPTNVVGLSIDTSDRTVVSVGGLNNVQFANLLPGGQYTVQRANGTPIEFEALEVDFAIPVSGASS